MSEYYPDRWVIIDHGEKYNEEKIRYSVLGSWYGGFAGSDYWRRSSPIGSIVIDGDIISCKTRSGSVYFLHKHAEGQSMLISSLLSQTNLRVVEDIDEVVNFLKKH